MDKEVEDSIQRFENKKEFRAVKLQTRQSFREDQVALDKRLSKYRQRTVGLNGVRSGADDSKRSTDGHANGHVNNGYLHDTCSESSSSGLSKLESIVMDLSIEMEEERERRNSTNADLDNDGKTVDDTSFFFGGLTVQDSVKVQKEHGGQNSNPSSPPHTGNVKSKVITQNGGHFLQTTVLENGTAPNGAVRHISANGFLTNGQAGQHSTLIIRPKVNGHVRGSMTPEPKMKLAKGGIYQKNPKLTSASTDHLDNISLRSFKTSARPVEVQGQGQQQVFAPVIASADVTSLPQDGNLGQFSVSQMVTIFRLLNLPGALIYKLSQCNVDGKRFALFTDQELVELGMYNPIVTYFRDRSAAKPRRKKPLFIL